MKHLKRRIKPYKKKSKLTMLIRVGIILAVVVFVAVRYRYVVTEANHQRNKQKGLERFEYSEDFVIDDELLILVNEENPIPDDFSPILEKTSGGFETDYRVIDDLSDILEEAQEDGVRLWIISAYRNHQKQTEIFGDKLDENKRSGYAEQDALDETTKYIAVPGTSEHYTGLAVDFNSLENEFEDTEAFEWLSENAHKYGFILRYDHDKTDITGKAYEPWHYRYVGAEHATIIKEGGYCLEEYLEALRKGTA